MRTKRRRRNPLATQVAPQRGYAEVVSALRRHHTLRVHVPGATYLATHGGGDRYELLLQRRGGTYHLVRAGSAGQVATRLIHEVGEELAIAAARRTENPLGLSWPVLVGGVTALGLLGYYLYASAQAQAATTPAGTTGTTPQLPPPAPSPPPPPPPSGGQAQGQTWTLTSSNAGQSITVKVGDTVNVMLPAVATATSAQTALWNVSSSGNALTGQQPSASGASYVSNPYKATSGGTVSLTAQVVGPQDQIQATSPNGLSNLSWTVNVV